MNENKDFLYSIFFVIFDIIIAALCIIFSDNHALIFYISVMVSINSLSIIVPY